jgi:hypothetical protein
LPPSHASITNVQRRRSAPRFHPARPPLGLSESIGRERVADRWRSRQKTGFSESGPRGSASPEPMEGNPTYHFRRRRTPLSPGRALKWLFTIRQHEQNHLGGYATLRRHVDKSGNKPAPLLRGPSRLWRENATSSEHANHNVRAGYFDIPGFCAPLEPLLGQQAIHFTVTYPSS